MKGNWGQRCFPVVGQCFAKYFVVVVVLQKFACISSLFPYRGPEVRQDLMVHPPTATPAPWLGAALRFSNVSHCRDCPKNEPSADTVLLGSCAQLRHIGLLLAIALSYEQRVPEESQASSFAPSTLPRRGCLLLTNIIEPLIQARWNQWGSFCWLPDICLLWVALGTPGNSWFLPSLHLSCPWPMPCCAGLLWLDFNEAWAWFRQGPCPFALEQGGGSLAVTAYED